MSLFKSKEVWHTQCGDGDEEFDLRSVCVGNVDNSEHGKTKIVVGSLQGLLRIYNAQQKGYLLEHLMLEQDLGAPILAVEMGPFVADRKQALAILQPRKLSVYNLIAEGDPQSNATHYSLQLVHEYALEHTASTICYGAFGGSSAPEQIAVLSMDGQLSVLSRGATSFQRQLPGFLLPGPLLYSPSLDAFLTVSSALELECYAFASLAHGASADAKAAPTGSKDANALPALWRVVIGEPAVDMALARLTASLSPGQTDVLVLGERTLYAVSEAGQLRLQMRLEYPPAALAPFLLGAGVQHGLVVASGTGALLVYHERRLVWSARTETAPAAVRIGRFFDLPGMLVTLDHAGSLSISCLGTSPPTSLAGIASAGAAAEPDYEAMDEEHRRLQAVIRQAGAGDADAARPAEPTDVIVVRAQLPAALDREPRRGGDEAPAAPQITVRLFVSYTGAGCVEGATLHLEPPFPVRCAQTALALPTVRGSGRGTPLVVPVVLLASKEALPGSAQLGVTVCYTTPAGEPRTTVAQVTLPLCLFAMAVPPIKAAQFKLTLDTNRPPPMLTRLFEDLGSAAVQSNAASFQYWCGDDVTVIVSKSAGRFRLQSNQFEAIWMLAEELQQRLRAYWAAEPPQPGESPLAFAFEEGLPLEDLGGCIDAHFAARAAVAAQTAQLDERAAQFRAVQKRLLMRYKDKAPQPLAELGHLLEGAFRMVQEAGVAVERAQRECRRQGARLQGALRLTAALLGIKCRLDAANAEALRSYLCIGAEETPELGWPELAEASIGAALRGALGKGTRDAHALPAPLAPLADTARLKRMVQTLAERLAKGGKLVSNV